MFRVRAFAAPTIRSAMASKFEQFLTDKKIDPRRVMIASRLIERLRPEDRSLKLKKRLGKKAEGGEKATGKPRSGRPVTPRLLAQATGGKKVSGAQKTRLLRAVNRILEQKKQPAAELKALF
jgi:hypothetical protein